MDYLFFFLGLILLISGAELLVRGASRLAAAASITPLVVGLTVVAFGTSSPELAVSMLSALEGPASADIAVGNVVGSNIFNVLFILGLSALAAPLIVDQKLVRMEVPIMIGVSGLLVLLGLDGHLSRIDGVVLYAGIIGYTTFAIRQGRQATDPVLTEYEEAFPAAQPKKRIVRDLLLIVTGLAMLVLGSHWLVEGSVTIARGFGVSELIISLTIIAAGTSLPEVATSLLASLRGQRDIAVGNVVGSNIFNVLAVLGLSAVAAPTGITISQPALAFDIPVMIAAAVICLPIFFTGYRIGRLEGALFLGYYIAYLAYVILAANAHDVLPIFSALMLYFTVPATLLILSVATIRQTRFRAQDGMK